MNMETAEIKAMLIEKYRRSEYADRVRTRIQEITSMVNGPHHKLTNFKYEPQIHSNE